MTIDIDALRLLREKATPGEWFVDHYGPPEFEYEGYHIGTHTGGNKGTGQSIAGYIEDEPGEFRNEEWNASIEADFAFIAAAANAVPDLLDEITTLRARLAECEADRTGLSEAIQRYTKQDAERIAELSRQHADDAKRIAELTQRLQEYRSVGIVVEATDGR